MIGTAASTRSEPDPVEQFRAALDARGIIVRGAISADGELHRCDAEGPGGKGDASYLLHGDGIPAGGFQNWRDGLGWETWRADLGRELTADEREDLRRKAEADRIKRAAEQARRQAEAAAKAAEILAAAKPCAEHRYAADKGVQLHGLSEYEGDLIVPLRDASGALHGVQRIRPDGAKRFLYGGGVTGCYHAIGGKPDSVILVGEGFATCASANEATGHPVAVAFDCGNLKPVAEALRAKFPDVKIVLLADDDYRTVGNPGLSKGKEAAAAVNGAVAVPEFGPARPRREGL
jgi:putative DNA primase/helicase